MQMVNKFLRRLDQRHLWFLDLKTLKLLKKLMHVSTQLKLKMKIQSKRSF